MLHQQFRIVQGIRYVPHLLLVELRFPPGRLPLVQGIVHLRTGIQQRLLELKQSLFLLRLTDFQVGYQLPALKEGLYQGAHRL